jgi:hypothetical protein
MTARAADRLRDDVTVGRERGREPALAALVTGIEAWIFHWRLDEELARGASPRGRLLGRRGRALTSRRTRERLARSLDGVVTEARGPVRRRGSALPVDREAVGVNEPLILGLVRDLREPARVSPEGVARTLRLLHDGASSVYTGGIDELGAAVRHAATGLHFGPMLDG